MENLEDFLQILPYEDALRDKLISVWEKSVRATHLFVESSDLDYYKEVVS